MVKIRPGNFYRDFIDGTYQQSMSTLSKEKAEQRAANLKRQGYKIHITTSKEPDLSHLGISKDRLPLGYPRTHYNVWQRKAK